MSFVLARLKGSGVPRVRELPMASSTSFTKGALLVVNNSGQFAECAANPTAVAAVAMSPAGTDATGLNHTGRIEFPPNVMGGVAVQDEVWFSAEFVGDLPANPGASYGVTKGSDGVWRVDFDKDGTGENPPAAVVKYQAPWDDGVITRNRVFVTFIPSVASII